MLHVSCLQNNMFHLLKEPQNLIYSFFNPLIIHSIVPRSHQTVHIQLLQPKCKILSLIFPKSSELGSQHFVPAIYQIMEVFWQFINKAQWQL